jgi:hypothetical protein
MAKVPRTRTPRAMLDKLGHFIGDKVGAVRGKLVADRLWIKGFGRGRKRIQRERERCAAMGKRSGTIADWVGRIIGFCFGKFF